jgi:hypothetical protein
MDILPMRNLNERDMLRWYATVPGWLGTAHRWRPASLPARPHGGERIAMDAIDLENRIAESTTRRTVVTTGVKLA